MSANTQTEICNLALAGCGARSTIVNIREDSNEARKCLLFYDTTRDALLRAAQWNFSRTEDYLTLLRAAPGTPEYSGPLPVPNSGAWNPATMPPAPWLYAYAYPTDCVRMWSILPFVQTNNVGSGVPIFSTPNECPPPAFGNMRRGARFIEGTIRNANNQRIKALMTNQEQAIGVWGARIEEVPLWDASFVTAMIGSLSWQLCIPLSGDKTLAKQGHDAAVEAIMNARVNDGNEGTTNVNTIPDWLAIRGFSGDWSTSYSSAYCAGWENPSFLGL